jgi:myo-inositol-1(or 4)-monophosphatase
LSGFSADFEALEAFAIALAHASGSAILPYFRQVLEIDNKLAAENSAWDPVTEADRAGERAIRAMIEQRFPDHGIIGEEYGSKVAKSDFTWVLDPIDGTRAFVIGMPTWATLIGLYHKNQPVLGLMHQPFVCDLFVGSPNGAYLDHRGQRHKLKCRSAVPIGEASIGTTSPHLYKDEQSARFFANLHRKAKTVRYGGDAYFFALLAAGHLDIAMDCGLQIYDIAALIPIIKAAGGAVGTWDGKDPSLGGNIIAASSAQMLETALQTMAEA